MPYKHLNTNLYKVIGERKKDHLDLATTSQIGAHQQDQRFYYNPLTAYHPSLQNWNKFFPNHKNFPFWISSMTGGTDKALTINTKLQELAKKFGLGMGLGSLRPLWEQFLETGNDVKNHPLWSQFFFSKQKNRPLLLGNIGIGQLEEIEKKKQFQAFLDFLCLLQLDGLFVHLNPLQEWAQGPEGNKLSRPIEETLLKVFESFSRFEHTYSGKFLSQGIFLKEVGQGICEEGIRSMALWANRYSCFKGMEMAALGGTNFTQLELARRQNQQQQQEGREIFHSGAIIHSGLPFIGHSKKEMLQALANTLFPPSFTFIISGGISGPLEAYYYLESSHFLQEREHPIFLGMARYFLSLSALPMAEMISHFQDFLESLLFFKTCLSLRVETEKSRV